MLANWFVTAWRKKSHTSVSSGTFSLLDASANDCISKSPLESCVDLLIRGFLLFHTLFTVVS